MSNEVQMRTSIEQTQFELIPFEQQPTRKKCTSSKQEEMYKIIQELLHFGLIRPSDSPYAAPALLGDVPNLKCFHLSCNYETFYYDELILSLLYRMSNLEELDELELSGESLYSDSLQQYFSHARISYDLVI
ncbi:unnamed protein product [Rotaria sordida]|uniref:Uncharacterized protein n=1 Tax=Rotaria sordida TaxID=392033 RepID=A0A814RGW1_9BILA|nr:unnamed protein product [Rotaria sordida]